MNKFKLIFDLTGDFSYIYLINDEQVIDYVKHKNNKDLSINLNNYLNNILSVHHLKKEDIEALYLVYGPGKFSAMRIGSSFMKTWKLIKPNIKTYILDRFHFWTSDKSLIIINADGNKYFMAVMNGDQYLIEPKLINQDQLELIRKLQIEKANAFKFIDNYGDINNIINNLKHAKEVDETFELNYLKDKLI